MAQDDTGKGHTKKAKSVRDREDAASNRVSEEEATPLSSPQKEELFWGEPDPLHPPRFVADNRGVGGLQILPVVNQPVVLGEAEF